MSSIELRLASLEAMISELKTENELLKMLTPLEAFTEGLKAASPAEVSAWMDACKSVTAEHAPPSKKGKKVVTTEKKNTNPTGPAEFNAFVQAVWHEMAASAGVVGEHDDAFKKASKDVGITFQKARAEASRRKAEMEGRDTPALKKVVTPAPKKVVTPAPAPAPLPKSTPISMPTPEIPSDEDILAATAEYDDVERERMKKECESYGWEPRMFNGIARWLDPSSGDVYSYDAISTIGIYDSENNEFFPTE
jgi:hypothetical protein